jgi:hypothetical protein
MTSTKPKPGPMTSTKPAIFKCEHVQKLKTAWFNQWNMVFCYLIITSLLHPMPSCRPIVGFSKCKQRDSSATKKERWLSTPIGHLLYKYLNRKWRLHVNSQPLKTPTLIGEKRKIDI